MRRRHPDVDDGDVWRQLLDQLDHTLRIRRGANDFVPSFSEKVRQTGSEQAGVVGNYDPHGTVARIVVPLAFDEMVAWPPAASTRSRSPRRPLRSESAPPQPLS